MSLNLIEISPFSPLVFPSFLLSAFLQDTCTIPNNILEEPEKKKQQIDSEMPFSEHSIGKLKRGKFFGIDDMSQPFESLDSHTHWIFNSRIFLVGDKEKPFCCKCIICYRYWMISIKANNIPHFSLDVTIVVGKTLRYSKHTTLRDKTEQHFIQSDNKLNWRIYKKYNKRRVLPEKVPLVFVCFYEK
jgi:hypothetical protein